MVRLQDLQQSGFLDDEDLLVNWDVGDELNKAVTMKLLKTFINTWVTVSGGEVIETGLEYLAIDNTSNIALPDTTSISVGEVIALKKLLAATPVYEVDGSNGEQFTTDGVVFTTTYTHSTDDTKYMIWNGTNWEVQ